MRKLIMKVARSNVGGSLACFVIDKCIGVLPVKVKEKTQQVVIFSHPAPVYPVHDLIIPIKRRKDIFMLLQDEATWSELADMVKKYAFDEKLQIACNYGTRQDVKQVHFHVYQDLHFQLIESSEKLQKYMIGNIMCLFDQDANFYIEKDKMTDLAYMRAVMRLAKGKFPEGFTLVFYGGWAK